MGFLAGYLLEDAEEGDGGEELAGGVGGEGCCGEGVLRIAELVDGGVSGVVRRR